MNIFEYTDYKNFIKKKIATYPKRGHGLLRQMGLHIGLSSVAISQIMKGHRDLTLEQALGVTEFFSLTSLERDYFLFMIQRDRAANHKLKKLFSEKMIELSSKAQNLKDRLSNTVEINTEAKAIYYSNWVYSAIRISSLIKGGQTIEEISALLDIRKTDLIGFIEFLTENGICQKKGDKYSTGLGITHLGAQSPLSLNHHKNWRIKAIEKMTINNDNEQIFYTIPMCLSAEDIKLVRKKIILLIEDINKLVGPSPSEDVACLNIDWFKFGKK